jgi:hypothetical protein
MGDGHKFRGRLPGPAKNTSICSNCAEARILLECTVQHEVCPQGDGSICADSHGMPTLLACLASHLASAAGIDVLLIT